MKLIIDNIVLRPDEDESSLEGTLARALGLEPPPDWSIVRKSLDSRNKRSIHYRYRIMVSVPDEKGQRLLGKDGISLFTEPAPAAVKAVPSPAHVAVVGTGPAGLFCALRLAEAGVSVTLFERGAQVEKRMHDIDGLEKDGVLDCESNVLFGEGGAGTYSDGKLTTRTSRPESRWFFARMVEMGAQQSILYEAKPHIGTDRLALVVKNIRRYLEGRGCSFRFAARVDGLVIREGCVLGLVSGGDEFLCDRVVLATGHSARDTYAMLEKSGVALARKAFAMGARIEHPRETIDDIQYGRPAFRRALPAAEYLLACKDPDSGRGVYSFCMCPGGRVINSSSEQGRLCTNGMSFSARDLAWSNAALVVTVTPEDFGGAGPLAGIQLQRKIEEGAFRCGGGKFYAPAQKVTSFLTRTPDASLPESTFRPGVRACLADDYLPDWITGPLRFALKNFDRKMKGFITEHALLIGAETRTSSPVRVSRGEDFQSVSHRGLYPAGEGSGYTGGIVSSAVDGIRAADAIIDDLQGG